MLEKLHLKNVGPAPELEMEFAPRVNLITGDNGLGKSFLLDVAWWALTNSFFEKIITPAHWNIVPQLDFKVSGKKSATAKSYFFSYGFFNWQDTTHKSDVSHESVNFGTGIVVYSSIEGSFAIHDPMRGKENSYTVLHGQLLWDGTPVESGNKVVSNGLIRDWVTWQLENAEAFQQFKAALAMLSPHEGEKLEPGKLTRVSLDDARDIPTLKMPYGQEVPITQASAGIRRVVSLAYMLVWTWQEHLRAAELTRQEPAREIVLLIDELEQHLHPRWQRVILPAILETVKELMKSDVRVQIVATTHSPFVMASLEPLYDNAQDAWFDLNLVKGKVTLEKMPWYKRGGIEDWVISEAFDLDSSGSVERERALEQAAKVIDDPKVTKTKFLNADKTLRAALSETDEFWVRWRYIGEKRGWL